MTWAILQAQRDSGFGIMVGSTHHERLLLQTIITSAPLAFAKLPQTSTSTATTTMADPVAQKSGFLCTYMSTHPDTLVAYVKYFGKVDGNVSSARMLSIDSKVCPHPHMTWRKKKLRDD
jgi:uncharacterized protein DUF2470